MQQAAGAGVQHALKNAFGQWTEEAATQHKLFDKPAMWGYAAQRRVMRERLLQWDDAAWAGSKLAAQTRKAGAHGKRLHERTALRQWQREHNLEALTTVQEGEDES